MFGYVVINKPELKIKDYDKYQEYYCGLCQSLKQNHGRRGQLTLNYDLNFNKSINHFYFLKKINFKKRNLRINCLN